MLVLCELSTIYTYDIHLHHLNKRHHTHEYKSRDICSTFKTTHTIQDRQPTTWLPLLDRPPSRRGQRVRPPSPPSLPPHLTQTTNTSQRRYPPSPPTSQQTITPPPSPRPSPSGPQFKQPTPPPSRPSTSKRTPNSPSPPPTPAPTSSTPSSTPTHGSSSRGRTPRSSRRLRRPPRRGFWRRGSRGLCSS